METRGERRTFLEWLKWTDVQRAKRDGVLGWYDYSIPEHKLKDPSLTERINRQKELQKKIAACDNIHEARKLYDDYTRERDKEIYDELRRKLEARENLKWEKFFMNVHNANEVQIKMPDGEIIKMINK